MSTSTTIAIDLRRVAHGTHLPIGQVQSVVQLLDAGNTVPFITRYRKDQTGGLDEEQIRDIQTRLARQRLLAERKQTILRSVESQGKLTQALAGEIEAADSIKRLEDLYLPFKPKKQTLATVARERGLEPLAEEILSGAESAANLDQRAADFVNPDRGVPTLADVMLGVGHILAEQFSELASLRQRLRKIVRHSGKLVSCRPADVDEKKAQGFRDYFEFSETLERVPPHRVLAINRGEQAKLLRVKVEADLESLQAATDELLVPPAHEHAEFLRSCGRDALARLVFPSLEREVRRELTERAEAHAVEVFARNLRKLLLQPPVRGRRVLALDPGFKSGCKIAALDEFGKLLDHAVIHLVGKSEEAKTEGRAKLVDLIQRHQLTLVAIGNGTACRESEELIASILAEELHDQGIAYVVVNEAGASVYSTSPLGREEFPEYDAVLRGAISIGRRIQDPLSELVKIEPANLGVGLYQHESQRMNWFSITAVPQYDPGSTQPDRALMIGSDVTGLQRDKALFERVQELAQIGGWQWDRQSDALYLTSESMRILRRHDRPASMAALLDCLDATDRKLLRKTLKSIKGDTGFDLDLRGHSTGGAPFWVRMIGEPDPFDPGCIRLAGTLQDITESKHAEEALREQARTDALTGLLNRDAILEHIRSCLQGRGGNDLAVLYIDLDRFKIVNDVLGHDAGDQLLVDVAHRLRSATCLALTDLTLLRIDGADFWQLLEATPSLALGVINTLAQRLDEAVTNLRLLQPGRAT